jgi:membrane protein implicated in regulation of membrane protease activity
MIIVPPLPEQAGTVRFSVPIVGAAEWMCRTTGEQVAVGDRVIVTDIVGNELIVSSMTSHATLHKGTQI